VSQELTPNACRCYAAWSPRNGAYAIRKELIDWWYSLN
jgi:hypothetical protein